MNAPESDNVQSTQVRRGFWTEGMQMFVTDARCGSRIGFNTSWSAASTEQISDLQ